jgi:alkaline phosphatase D
MKNLLKYLFIFFVIISCKNESKELAESDDLIIAFGSCNRQNVENKLWQPILDSKASVWIWGGDNIYSDTDDMELMKEHYLQQMNQVGYKELTKKVKVLGTWDDHDYGLNDAGVEFEAKQGSQQQFLDFIGVDQDDERRNREGVYHAEEVKTDNGSVKIIVLDTRYFRSSLTKSENPEFRYQPNTYGEGTILGEEQWQWLEEELKNSKADFNLIVSSIQFLSHEHGFEAWGNMPHEVDKLKTIIKETHAENVIILSGDRHISEFSKTNIRKLDYPLIDFTSSGMTHAYEGFDGEPNQYRVGEVVHTLSFGILKFNFEKKEVTMQMRGVDNVLQQEITHAY